MIRDYILPDCPEIKIIGISSSVFWFDNPGGDGDDSWNSAVINTKGFNYDKNHDFWQDSVPAQFDTYIGNAPFLNCSSEDTFGMSTDPCGGWGGSSPNLMGDITWTVNDSNYINNIALLKRLIQDLAARKVHLLMINFPESPAYKNTDHYNMDGASWPTGMAVVRQLEALQDSSPYFHFYDAYQNGNHDYTDAEAQNWNHLCPVGAAKLSTRLDSLIHTILQQ